MKKIICLLLFCFTLTGCTPGNKVSSDKGVTPRLNQDGSLYVK